VSRIVPEVDGVPIHVWLATPLGADVRTALERLAKGSRREPPRRHARRAGRLVDEAPTAYRDIRAVMRAQRELTAVRRELRPLVSHKAT